VVLTRCLCCIPPSQTLRKWLQDEERKARWKAIVAKRRELGVLRKRMVTKKSVSREVEGRRVMVRGGARGCCVKHGAGCRTPTYDGGRVE
jgi:hypothetical protein